VFLRYHERPEATTAAFVRDAGDAPDAPPWFLTGDTVTRDGADGPFKILGRTSQDILKSGGYKLSALEIEEALREHPAVSEVAVVGLPDETWGERVVACVVRKQGAAHAVTADDLRGFCKGKLAFYKVPKDVVLLGELPKNALGKVQKPALRADLARTERG
jgi:malonyl-CoA/methylmalonyl-CoA synthetase